MSSITKRAKETRACQRVRLSTEVSYSQSMGIPTDQVPDVMAEVARVGETNFFTGVTRDVGKGGIFIATDKTYNPGTFVNLGILVPDAAQPINVLGEVCWTRDSRPDDGQQCGMGVRFVNLRDADRIRIEEFVAERETLLFED